MLDDWIDLVELDVECVIVIYKGSLEKDEFGVTQWVAIAGQQCLRDVSNILGLHEDHHQ